MMYILYGCEFDLVLLGVIIDWIKYDSHCYCMAWTITERYGMKNCYYIHI